MLQLTTKEIFKKIWELALPYQDKRDDAGHAEIVTNFAILLCELEKASDDIIVPAAILHDIGWSQMPEGERFLIFDKNKTPEAERKVRIRHQEDGSKLANEILTSISYPKDLSEQIIEIISQHDTRDGFFSQEDGLMRDADKLWRYCKIGFNSDLIRSNVIFDYLYNKREKQIDEPNFFYSENAKQIARNELKIRGNEFKI